MTRKEMIGIINDVNTNKEIKWSVLSVGNGIIALGNSYDTGVKFTVDYSEENFVIVKDCLQGITCGSYLVGDEKYDDFRTLKEAVICGIAKAVKFFNYYY